MITMKFKIQPFNLFNTLIKEVLNDHLVGHEYENIET